MARGSIRRRFLVGSMVSTVFTLILFAVGSFAVVLFDTDAEHEIRQGDSYRGEAMEIIGGAMALATPLGLATAVGMAALLSRRSARPLEDAIRAARETTAHDLKRTLPVPEREDELRDLVVSLNDLFVRLDDGFGALARFAADASHELRTPLAVMATELEVALRHPRTTSEWETTAKTSLDELRRVSSLVEGLLTLARAGADTPTARVAVQLVECVDGVVAQLSSRADKAGIELAPPRDSASQMIDGNPVMIETAIRNLVENAIIATPAGGRIQISVEDTAAASTVHVDDTGHGIGTDTEALFVPFHRGASADTTVGAGLGLTIARRIATAHGGQLTATISPLGGARFSLSLPRPSSTLAPPCGGAARRA